MKKTYIIPELQIMQMKYEAMIAASEHAQKYESGGGDQLVKGADASPRSDYNVWNDDWSK